MDQVGLAFILLGWFLKDGPGADPGGFNPLVIGLCKDNSIHEAAAIVLDKMPKLGCAPDLDKIHNLAVDASREEYFDLERKMLLVVLTSLI